MVKRRGLLYTFTGLLAVLAILCGLFGAREREPFLRAEVVSGGQREQITLWEAEPGKQMVFLPSFARMEQVRLRTNVPDGWFLAGEPVTDGFSCETLRLNQPYSLTGQDGEQTITFVQSKGVPAMYVEVASGSMAYIHADRENQEPGSYHLYSETGELLHGGGLTSVKGRGNASWWSHEKKPYSLTLGAEADLLGMGRGSSWVLLANTADPTHMKNKLVLTAAEQAGLAFTPQCRWVELYLNGEYAGLYLLCERNEIHENRVAVSPEDGFLVSMELESRLIDRNRPYVKTAAGQALRIHQSGLEEGELLRLWQTAENAILAEDGIDPVTGKHWQELIDLDSWAKKYLLEEIFANIDACSVSQYFYADGSGRIYAGPAWDYDVTMMNLSPTCLFGIRHQAWEGKPTPWFHALYQQEPFRDRVVALYETVYRPLLISLLDEEMAAYAQQTASAAGQDQLRWQGADQDRALEETKAYMTQRLAFLDSLWLEEADYCLVYVDPGESTNGVYYAVRPGDRLPQLPEPAYPELFDYHGWYDADTGKPFDPEQPVYADMQIYLKQTDKRQDQTWVPAAPEETSEPLSLLRLGPVLVLLGILTALGTAELFFRRNTTGKREKQPQY